MKKLETILKNLAQLESELNNYNDEEIEKAIDNLPANIFNSTIIQMIYEGLHNGE